MKALHLKILLHIASAIFSLSINFHNFIRTYANFDTLTSCDQNKQTKRPPFIPTPRIFYQTPCLLRTPFIRDLRVGAYYQYCLIIIFNSFYLIITIFNAFKGELSGWMT